MIKTLTATSPLAPALACLLGQVPLRGTSFPLVEDHALPHSRAPRKLFVCVFYCPLVYRMSVEYSKLISYAISNNAAILD